MEYPWTAKEWARESRPSLDLVPTSNLRGGVKPVLVGWEGPRSKSLRRGGVKMKGTPAGGKKNSTENLTLNHFQLCERLHAF